MIYGVLVWLICIYVCLGQCFTLDGGRMNNFSLFQPPGSSVLSREQTTTVPSSSPLTRASSASPRKPTLVIEVEMKEFDDQGHIIRTPNNKFKSRVSREPQTPDHNMYEMQDMTSGLSHLHESVDTSSNATELSVVDMASRDTKTGADHEDYDHVSELEQNTGPSNYLLTELQNAYKH